MKRINKTKKIKHSFATYKQPNGENITDVMEVANNLKKWGEIPTTINDLRAAEIAMMAKQFIHVVKLFNDIQKGLKKRVEK